MEAELDIHDVATVDVPDLRAAGFLAMLPRAGGRADSVIARHPAAPKRDGFAARSLAAVLGNELCLLEQRQGAGVTAMPPRFPADYYVRRRRLWQWSRRLSRLSALP